MEECTGFVAPTLSQWLKRELGRIVNLKICTGCYILIVSTDSFQCEEGCSVCQKCMEKLMTKETCRLTVMVLRCPTSGCYYQYVPKSLKGVLSQGLYSKVCRLVQAKVAGIDDLELCFYCNFIGNISRSANIFKCLNRKCKKRTCRWCKGPAHIPNGCNASPKNVIARTYVEMEMSKAFMSICYGCQKRYYIEDGCNVVECNCGVVMCYYCKKPMINNYSLCTVCTSACVIYDPPTTFNMMNVIGAAKRAMEEVDDNLTIHAIDKIIDIFQSTLAPEPEKDEDNDTEWHYSNGYLSEELGEAEFAFEKKSAYDHWKLTNDINSDDSLEFEFHESASIEMKSLFDHWKQMPKMQIQYYGHLALWTMSILVCLKKFK